MSKFLLTIKEASEYFNIGQSKLRELTKNPNHDFVFRNGCKRMIKRDKFEEWINITSKI